MKMEEIINMDESGLLISFVFAAFTFVLGWLIGIERNNKLTKDLKLWEAYSKELEQKLEKQNKVRKLQYMRMWNINPKKLCKNHLLGEHVEMHKLVGNLTKGRSIQGYINLGLVEVHNIRKRHNELAVEMKRRGYNHKSPLPGFKVYKAGKVDPARNRIDLRNRCKNCKV